MLIGDMVVTIAGDERPLAASLHRGERLVETFTQSAMQRVATMTPKARTSGFQLAEGILAGARQVFERQRGELVDALLGGRITTEHFQRQGEEAAKAFQQSLERGMQAMKSGTAGFKLDADTGKWRGRIQHLEAGELMQGLAVLTNAAEREGAHAAEEFAEAMFGGLAIESGAHQDDVRAMFATLRETAQREGTTLGHLLAEGMQIGYTQQWNAMKAAKLPAMSNVMQGRRPDDMAGGGMMGGAGGIRTNALLGAGFALESIMRAEGKVEKTAAGVRSAMQTISLAISRIHPVASVAIMAGTGLVDMLANMGKKARDAKADLADLRGEIAQMVNAGDSTGLLTKMRDLEIGSPGAGMGLGGGFKGSIRDLEAQKRAAEQNMRAHDGTEGRAWNFRIYTAEKRRIEELTAKLEPLYRDFNMYKHELLNRPDALPDIGPLPAVSVTANSPTRQAKADMEALRSHVSTLTTSWEQLNKPGERTVGLMQQVLATYNRLGNMLAAVNPFSEQANTIRAMRADLEKIERIQFSINPPALTADRLQLMSSTPAPIAPWAKNTLETPIVTPPGTGGIMGTGDASFLKDVVLPQVTGLFSDIGSAIGGILTASFGPVAILMEILRPALEAVTPLFRAVLAPLAAVVQVIAVGLEPVLRLLFPVIKGIAWVLSLFGEVTARITAAIAQGVGSIWKAIGSLISKIPGLGGFGRAIMRAGQSVLNFSAGMRESAAKMAQARKELGSMQFGDTAESITGLGDAARATAESLSNVPEIFKLTLAQLRHFGIETVYGQQQQTPPSAAAPSPTVITFGDINVNEVRGDANETAREVVKELERVANAYGMGTPWHAVPSSAL